MTWRGVWGGERWNGSRVFGNNDCGPDRPALQNAGGEETETKTEAGAGAEAEADDPSAMSAPQGRPPGVHALRFPSPYRVYPVHPLTSMLPPERACMAILSNARADMRTLKNGGQTQRGEERGGSEVMHRRRERGDIASFHASAVSDPFLGLAPAPCGPCTAVTA